MIPGSTVEAVVSGKRVSVGSPLYAARLEPLSGDAQRSVGAGEAQGKTVVVVAMDGVPTVWDLVFTRGQKTFAPVAQG